MNLYSVSFNKLTVIGIQAILNHVDALNFARDYE
jgi:hypothetical protein